MRDSRMAQNLADIANIAQTKLGKEWALPVLLMCAGEMGFVPTRRITFDGEIAELTISRLSMEILSDVEPTPGEPA
jgi:hypothetical protein